MEIFITAQTINYVKNFDSLNSKLNEIGEKLDQLEQTLNTIESKIDEIHLIRLRKGYNYLLNALNTDSEEIRAQELLLAHEEFSHIICLNPEMNTGEFSNIELICNL